MQAVAERGIGEAREIVDVDDSDAGCERAERRLEIEPRKRGRQRFNDEPAGELRRRAGLGDLPEEIGILRRDRELRKVSGAPLQSLPALGGWGLLLIRPRFGSLIDRLCGKAAR